MQYEPAGRELTHDEKKAAEAAFTGGQFNPEWSESARKVYDGISGCPRESISRPSLRAPPRTSRNLSIGATTSVHLPS